nr:uncharacterized protein LOC109147815 [Ipomoea trifida]
MGYSRRLGGGEIPNYGEENDLFTVKIRHGGNLSHSGSISYVGGYSDYFDNVEVDEWGYMTIKDLLNDLGFNIEDCNVYAVVGDKLTNVISDLEAWDLIDFEGRAREVELWVGLGELDAVSEEEGSEDGLFDCNIDYNQQEGDEEGSEDGLFDCNIDYNQQEGDANEASSQDIPESQPIPDSAPENPSHEIEVGDHMVYNDEMPGETENTSHEFEVETDEIHTPNIPSETETPFVEVDVGHEDVQLVQVPFLREQRAVQQPPKKQKTLGLQRQVKTKHVATRKYRTRSTVGFKSKCKGNFSEPIELD